VIRIPELPRFALLDQVLHFAFPAFRVLVLLPLFIALLYPRLDYRTVDAQDEEAPTVSSFLLRPEQSIHTHGLMPPDAHDSSKYGTFRSARSNLQRSTPTTRAATPAPSTAPDQKAYLYLLFWLPF